MATRLAFRLTLLTAILLLAAATRILAIDAQSLWIDEGFTYFLTQYHSPLVMLRKDVHPPLYFLLIDQWVRVAGTSELSLRFFSVLPSLVSIALIHALANDLAQHRRLPHTARRWFPILAALLLALADAENFLAQEARSYTWHVMLALLSMLGFLRWVRCGFQAGWRGWWLWLISTLLLIHTFYLGAWIGVVQGLYALIFLRRDRRWLVAIGTLVLAALALMPWLAYSLGEQSGNLSYANWIQPDAAALYDLVRRWFTNQWPLMLALAGLGLVVLTYKDERPALRWRPSAPVVLLLLWLIVPLVLTIAINEALPLYTPRRVSQITPAVALLVALGLVNLRPLPRWLLVGVIVVYGVTTVDFWRDKQPWRTLAETTAPLIAADEPVLVELGGDDYAPVYHYTRALPPGHDVTGLTTWRHLEPDTYADGMPALIAAQERLWLFYWSSDRGALDWLDWLGFTRALTLSVDFNPDVTVSHYARLPAEPVARYETGLVLRHARIGDGLRTGLWWSADAALAHDYTTSAFLLDDAGRLVAQQDTPPLRDWHLRTTPTAQIVRTGPTSTWPPGAVVYDPKRMTTTDGQALPPGAYQVGVVVYRFADGHITRLLTTDGADSVMLGTLVIG